MTSVLRLGEIGDAAGFEGEIRDFVRRGVTRQRSLSSGSEEGAESVSALVERVAGATVAEIDRLIAELQTMRDTLRNEGERVRRELTGYAGLNQSAMTSLKIVADTLAQFKPDNLQAPAEAAE